MTSDSEKLQCLAAWEDLGLNVNTSGIYPYYCNSSTTILYKALAVETNDTILAGRNYDLESQLLDRSYEMIIIPIDPLEEIEVSII